MRIRIEIRNLFDPKSGMENLGTGINIPDPQHWCKALKLNALQ